MKLNYQHHAATGAADCSGTAAECSLPDQRKELIDSHFQAWNRRCNDPEDDEHKTDKGKIVRPVRLVMMHKRHLAFPPKADSATRLMEKSCADLGHPASPKSPLVSAC
jgi:hypothetical protein